MRELYIVFLISLFFVVFIYVNSAILNYFPEDHWLRVWWEKHICSSKDLEP
jgi:hypothetical protein